MSEIIKIEDYALKVQTSTSSKGFQQKFKQGNLWIKLDSNNFCEGLAEEFAYLFSECILNFSSIPYKTAQFQLKDTIYRGCYSTSIYAAQQGCFIGLGKLFKYYGISSKIFIKDSDTYKNIQAVIQTVYHLTGCDITEYLTKVLLFDALIQNEDRHQQNLGLWKTNIGWQIAPCFDNGASFYATNWSYKQHKTLEDNINFTSSCAKPFSKFYDKQVQACLMLSKEKLIIDRAKYMQLMNYINPLYTNEQIQRAKDVLNYKLKYYEGTVFIWN